MIKKLICFLWGHITTSDVFSGRKVTLSTLWGGTETVPVMHKRRNEYCPRCGKKI